MAVDIQKIAKNSIKSVASGEMVTLDSLWSEKTVVITFFRRFGCQFCRLAAKDLSTLKPQLDAANVVLVGVGLEELGVEEFVEGKFFDGDLYIDTDKQTYKALGYKRFGLFSVFKAVLGSIARAAMGRAKSMGITGNLKGDGFQNGGSLIVNTEGKVLLSYYQENPSAHVELADVLKALGIEGGQPEDGGATGGKPEVVCDENACQLK